MNITKRNKRAVVQAFALLLCCAAAFVLVFAQPAAAVKLSEVTQGWTDEFRDFVTFGKALCVLVGFAFFIGGLFKFRTNQSRGEGIGAAIVLCLVGMALVGAPFLLAAGSESFTDGQSSDAIQDLGIQ